MSTREEHPGLSGLEVEPDEGLETSVPAAVTAEAESRPPQTERDEAFHRLQEENKSLLERLARLQAEFENFRKRNAREQAEFREYASAEVLRSMLQVLDNLDLALRVKKSGFLDELRVSERRKDELRTGVELIRRQMEDALARHGVQPVVSTGYPFDPHVHEAVEMVESAEAEDNHVIEELQRGFRLKDRLLRPAMVKVSRNPRK